MNYLLLFSFSNMFANWKGQTLVLCIGLVMGLVLGILMKWRSLGVWFSMLLGLAGAWLYYAFLSDYYTYSKSHHTNEIICACVGAFILTVTINLIFGSNKGRDRTFWRA